MNYATNSLIPKWGKMSLFYLDFLKMVLIKMGGNITKITFLYAGMIAQTRDPCNFKESYISLAHSLQWD